MTSRKNKMDISMECQVSCPGVTLAPRPQPLMHSIMMNRELSDTTLEIKQEHTRSVRIPVHSLILRSKSEVFNNMLQPGRFKEGHNNHVVVEGFRYENVRRFLEYIYVEKLPKLRWCDMVELMKIAHYYQVFDLMTLIMARIKAQLDLDNSLEICELAEQFSLNALAKAGLQVLSKGAFYFFDQKMHVDASRETLTALISMDNLNVETEYQVLQALWYWSEWCCWRQNVDSTAENIIANISQEMLENIRWSEDLDKQLEACCITFPIHKLRKALVELNDPNTSGANCGADVCARTVAIRGAKPRRTINSHPPLNRLFKELSILSNCTFSPMDFMFPAGSSDCIIFSTNRDIFLMSIEFFILGENGLFPNVKDHLKLKIIKISSDKAMHIRQELPIEYRFNVDQRSGQTSGNTWYWSSTITAEMLNVVRLRKATFYVVNLSKTCNPEKIIYHKHARRNFCTQGDDGLQILTHSSDIHAVQKMFYIKCRDK